MSIPLNAIDPEQGYREWVAQYLWHVDQLPYVLVETTGFLDIPSLRASRPDQVKVGGGGYVDNIPISEGNAVRDSRAVWVALRAYLMVAGSRLGVDAPQIPSDMPENLETVRAWAYSAADWMTVMVEHILDWPDLSGLERTLFRRIATARSRMGDAPAVVQSEPELCDLCLMPGVRVDWVAGPGGQVVLARACTVCGDTKTKRKQVERDHERSKD